MSMVVEGEEDESIFTRMKDDMEELGLHPEWVVFRDIWRDLTYREKRLTLAERGRNGRFKNKW